MTRQRRYRRGRKDWNSAHPETTPAGAAVVPGPYSAALRSPASQTAAGEGAEGGYIDPMDCLRLSPSARPLSYLSCTRPLACTRRELSQQRLGDVFVHGCQGASSRKRRRGRSYCATNTTQALLFSETQSLLPSLSPTPEVRPILGHCHAPSPCPSSQQHADVPVRSPTQVCDARIPVAGH